MRFGLRSFATFMIAALAFVGFGAINAGAAVTPHSVSFLGTYRIHGKITGTHSHAMGTFVVMADGTVEDSAGDIGSWTSSGRSFSMTFTSGDLTEQWLGRYSKTGISSKDHRGTFTINVSPELQGTWWAVRIP